MTCLIEQALEALGLCSASGYEPAMGRILPGLQLKLLLCLLHSPQWQRFMIRHLLRPHRVCLPGQLETACLHLTDQYLTAAAAIQQLSGQDQSYRDGVQRSAHGNPLYYHAICVRDSYCSRPAYAGFFDSFLLQGPVQKGAQSVRLNQAHASLFARRDQQSAIRIFEGLET